MSEYDPYPSARDDVCPSRLQTGPASRRLAQYLLAGFAGAMVIVGAIVSAAFLVPESIAQSTSTETPAPEKAPTKPKPKSARKPATSTTTSKPAVQQSEPQPGAQAPATQTGDSVFIAHTRQAGLTTCKGIYPTLGQMLTQGTEYMVQSKWHSKSPNAFPIQALVGMNYVSGTYKGPAFGAIFASPNGQRCEGDMIRIVPLQQDCQTAATQLPQGSQQAVTLSGIPVYDLPNGGGQAILMTAGTSCVALTVLSVGR